MNFIREVGPDPLKPVELEDYSEIQGTDRKSIEKENRTLMKYMTDPGSFVGDLQLLLTEDFDKANVSNVYNLILMFEQTLSGNKEAERLTQDQKMGVTEAIDECFELWVEELKKLSVLGSDSQTNYQVISEILKIISRVRFEKSIWVFFQIDKSKQFLEMEKTVKDLQNKYLSKVSATASKFKRDKNDKKAQKIKNSVKKFIFSNPTTYKTQKFFNDFKHTLTKEEIKQFDREANMKLPLPVKKLETQ